MAAIGLACILGMTGCGNDGGDSDRRTHPASTSSAEGLPTGPVPDEGVYPNLEGASALRAGDRLWVTATLVSQSDVLRVAWDLQLRATVQLDQPDDDGDTERTLHVWRQTFVVEPGQTLPIALSVPITPDMGLDPGVFHPLIADFESYGVKNLAWAHPWAHEPLVTTAVAPNPDLASDSYYAPWTATFESDGPVTGTVFCYDSDGLRTGSSLGPVQGTGSFTVDVVIDAGNQEQQDVSDPDKIRPTATECRLYRDE
ncbi:hypothetical protein ASG90_02350 [Nocardioides sp. Soil797]|nr:hypothetical protein ASG90_02350 [Nocardioides sp. Soil797]